MKTLRILIYCIFLCSIGTLQAQKTAYVCLNNADLLLVDFDKCSSQKVGTMKSGLTNVVMFDIAIGPTGILYGVSAGATPGLYRIEKQATAGALAVTLIGTLPLLPGNGAYNSLVCDKNGNLYAASDKTTMLYQIDPQTAQITVLGNMGFQAAGDLTFYEGKLYLAAMGNNLVEVNLANLPASRLIGQMNTTAELYGIVTIGSENCDGGRPQMVALGGFKDFFNVSTISAAVTRTCSALSLPSNLYGAASLLESSTLKRFNAGLDSTANFCENTSSIALGNLLRQSDAGGTWRDLDNSGALSGATVSLAQLKTNTPYRFRYVVGTGICLDTAFVTVKTQRLQTQSLPKDSTLCEGSTWTINLADSEATYLWQDGSKSSQYSISKAGNYSVKITKACGSYSLNTVVKTQRLQTQSLPKDSTLCEGSTWTINLADSEATYLWQDGSKSSQYSISKAGNYSVKITKACGSYSLNTVVKTKDCTTPTPTPTPIPIPTPTPTPTPTNNGCLLFFPDAFSPNGDGENETFDGFSECEFLVYQLQIFDRWGEVIFEATEPKKGWDGRLRGTLMPNAVYAYTLKYQRKTDADTLLKYGSVLLIR